jgi:predicted metalloendopeptidase
MTTLRIPGAGLVLGALLAAACAVPPPASQDFYQHVNARWLSAHPIPPEYSSFGAFHEIFERNILVLREVLEDAAARRDDPALDADLRLVGTFWTSGMNTARIEELGALPLQPELEVIAAISTREALIDALAYLQRAGVGAAFGAGPEASFVNPQGQVLFMIQGGLGLPEPSYYSSEEPEKAEIRAAYVAHVKNMFVLLGQDVESADDDAALVLALETRLAAVMLPPEQMRDMTNLVNEISFEQAEAVLPHLGLRRWLRGLGAEPPAVINVATPTYFAGLDRVLAEGSLDEWRAYLRFQTVSAFADYLPAAFEQEDFAFHGALLMGEEEMKPRWKRMLTATEAAAGEAAGKAFVARSFSPRAKALAEQMVADLLAAYRENIETLEWMGPETKAEALKKLAALGVKIGYPSKWKDYSGLQFEADQFLRNAVAAARFNTADGLAKVGRPTDPTEWGMTPQTVNAYYHPMRNEIVFPAGILQPPFFSEEMDIAANYGAMGAVIGHEITHGFDDQGSQFDAGGVFRVWWTEADRAEFEQRAQRLVEQADAHRPLPEVSLNGKLTLGENIADLGGLKMAYRGLTIALQRTPAGESGGLTPEQRFFHAWAVAWRENSRPESVKIQVATDPHATTEFRCNGPLSNLPEFADAFGVKEGSPMARPAALRVVIW